jgi:putative ABC transport system substrate-binding protein
MRERCILGTPCARRQFLLLGLAALTDIASAYAQRRHELIVGILWHGSKEREEANPFLQWFHEDFNKLGFAAGEVVFEERFASERQDLYEKYATELVAVAPDVLVTFALPGALALKRATQSIPIVFVGVPDPVAVGLVASLARPGANITGVVSLAGAIYEKRLALFREVVPTASRVGLLVDRDVPFQASLEIDGYTKAAAQYNIEIRAFHAKDAEQLKAAFSQMVDQKCDSVIIGAQLIYYLFRSEIASLALSYRLPSMAVTALFVSDGALMAYALDTYTNLLLAATYVKRIFNGEKPADLPVQQPSKLELVINLKTAAQLGLSIPASVIARADQVLE